MYLHHVELIRSLLCHSFLLYASILYFTLLQLLKRVSNVKALGCGAYHSMVVVVGDIVYACGLNNYGQLGLGDNDTEARDYLVRTCLVRFLLYSYAVRCGLFFQFLCA